MKLHPLFIDGFAGGGGASTGIGQALGRDVDIAINHSPTAIAIHKANHPDTEHHCTDIRAPFLPRTATRGRRVGGAWFSPDCKEYSKAKGGPVKDRSIRALCWEVIHWLEETLPDVGYLENVEEFEYAAPLDSNGVPLPDHKGREFKKFKRSIRRLGYRVQHRLLIACNYGAPTSRKRLYMIFRRDGKPIVWPKPTHAPANDPRVLAGKLLPYRTAAECIDWSIPCPSIFERD
ncbi:MAG: DNA cytosine methyltransferase, partial [Sphingopyxis terrae]|nr:DNA cytosine methyltransferase [Sphingopyxis terrae]